MQKIRVSLGSVLLSSVILFPSSSPVFGAEELTEAQLEKILAELTSIEAVVEGKRVSTRASALDMFRSASGSDKAAYEFYMTCVKELQFDRREARFSEFRDWRDKNEARLKEDSMVAAMRLQLQYLVLTLRAAEGVDRELIVPELEKFVAGIVANVEDLEGNGMKALRSAVNRTVFAEAYELNQSLQVEDWSYSPGNIGSVYDQSVFPFYREQNPEGLSAAWDRRIGLEKRMLELTQADNKLALENFQTERLPRMYWAKAVDLYRSASQQQGALSMIQILRANPDHPDATRWLEAFRNLLNGDGEADETAGDS
tara:strand:- start:4830 stop:5768 length:939 start_codon:yes stop_codon:yes gene_type:complete